MKFCERIRLGALRDTEFLVTSMENADNGGTRSWFSLQVQPFPQVGNCIDLGCLTSQSMMSLSSSHHLSHAPTYPHTHTHSIPSVLVLLSSVEGLHMPDSLLRNDIDNFLLPTKSWSQREVSLLSELGKSCSCPIGHNKN